ncbi:MAG: Unknown protein [uncultured Thiotrichaceae bacterium]|uniref:Uncharacterized protein n=1 Tax=uncultured Thiotrichaceae bacterium TaxID=298394 RepID=A0A6S6UKK9_9GAMM|nr:MAG: Unknown protein [uncultured Thiotrichaceae bacterium]
MQKTYTLTQKSLIVGLFLTLGIGLNDNAHAEYFDGISQNGKVENQHYSSLWGSHSLQAERNFSGNSSGEAYAKGDAEAEIEFSINLKAKVRSNAEMHQQRQFEGFMSQMRNIGTQMFQGSNTSNRMEQHYNQQNYYTPAPMHQQPVRPSVSHYQDY